MIQMNPLDGLLAPREPRGRYYGVTVGVVTNHEDKDKLGRVKVRFPWLSEEDEGYWARVATPMAGGDRGIYFLPQTGDEVLVAFEHGAIEFPYILGSLWNGVDKPPQEAKSGSENNIRLLKSRSGHIIRLDDTNGEEKIEIIDKSTKNAIVINTKENTITIKADKDITIESASGKLTLNANEIEMTAKQAMKINANQNIDIEAKAQLNLKGNAMVNIN